MGERLLLCLEIFPLLALYPRAGGWGDLARLLTKVLRRGVERILIIKLKFFRCCFSGARGSEECKALRREVIELMDNPMAFWS
jgi:hypothetical protein